MRIRKHAKISQLQHYASSSVFLQQHGCVLQPHLCQLNQSPWDVITFPVEEDDNSQQLLLPPAPSSFSSKLDGYDSCAVNGTCYDSEQSITSMKKLDDNREMKKMNFFYNNNVPANLERNEEMVDGNITRMCCKNDGKGWQCSREAKRGHHFAQVEKHYSNNNSAPYSTIPSTTAANKIKPTVEEATIETTASTRGRPHRPNKSSASDFYYYSGFGPLWGKKRGASTGNNNNASAAAEIYSSHDRATHGPQSSQMDNEDFEFVEVEHGKLINRTRKPIKAKSLKSLT